MPFHRRASTGKEDKAEGAHRAPRSRNTTPSSEKIRNKPRYNSSPEPPESEDEIPLNVQRLQRLELSTRPEGLPGPGQCIAHLKLLESLHLLRQRIGKHEGLYGLTDPPKLQGDKNATVLAKIREKRWQVFATHAVSRFEVWWKRCLSLRTAVKVADLQNKATVERVVEAALPIPDFTSHSMPPLDVLMVWHTYLLNPRAFLEDCFRLSKMDFYGLGIPWEFLDEAIKVPGFEYSPSLAAIQNFESATGLAWDPTKDKDTKTISCPHCGKRLAVPLSKGLVYNEGSHDILPGFGYADSKFLFICLSCNTRITHKTLEVKKFQDDMERLVKHDFALPGTVLARNGKPFINRSPKRAHLFPNFLMKSGVNETISGVVSAMEQNSVQPDLVDARREIEKAMNDRNQVRKATGPRSGFTTTEENLAMQEMMGRYWFNSSPFAIDLVAAVIRQGVFVDKAHTIGWLSLPNLQYELSRYIQKYTRFFALMSRHPDQECVPTLDVDLIWHTHQLTPRAYYSFSDRVANQLVDHDDKIPEGQLSRAFVFTSRKYQETWGEPYSECTCWYCESIREYITSRPLRFLRKSSTVAPRSASVTSDPLRYPHVSTHNVARDSNGEKRSDWANRIHSEWIDESYKKACKRARKEGREEPVRDVFFCANAWGCPITYPNKSYYPFNVDPSISGGSDLYVGDPAHIDSVVGAYGNCAGRVSQVTIPPMPNSSGTFIAPSAAAAAGGGGCGGGGC